MASSILIPTSKKEIEDALTSKFDGRSYNYFVGEIRRENKCAMVYYYFTGCKITIKITYWQDGINRAIETPSNCSTPTGAANKIAKFLDLK